MKLITKKIMKQIPAIGKSGKEPIVYLKLFCPWNCWTWYITEYSPEDKIAYGYVVGHEKELGYISIEELESIKHFSGLKIERDIYFEPEKLNVIIENIIH